MIDRSSQAVNIEVDNSESETDFETPENLKEKKDNKEIGSKLDKTIVIRNKVVSRDVDSSSESDFDNDYTQISSKAKELEINRSEEESNIDISSTSESNESDMNVENIGNKEMPSDEVTELQEESSPVHKPQKKMAAREKLKQKKLKQKVV